ncbi:DMT family transporter [Myceligenerans salitolerans]|uniref:DMT family transporter n=1 Tax=Myceligenerans salitolerans TaxID=1230528 RepID=A0ABS3IAR1_9MICO|nr:DMT family transporter [Myceligenerans salitolerans]MBO0610122.1 DMT family transporter [Myceligenerans salitolerans]
MTGTSDSGPAVGATPSAEAVAAGTAAGSGAVEGRAGRGGTHGGGALYAVIGMSLVGSLVAVSGTLDGAPLLAVQALRYTLAAVILVLVLRTTGRAAPRPRGREWAWLAGVALSGLVLFNVAVVRGVEHAEPAVIGVAVAAVPILLALVGPLAARSRPAPAVVAGAVVVTAGAVLVTGGGRTDAAGVGYALLTLGCEAGFTLLAVPVLRRLGPDGVTLHATWIAAAGFVVLSLATEGPAAVLTLGPGHLLATLHLAVFVTVVAFLLWYTAVGRLGPGRAGLFTGVVPVTSAVGGVLLGEPVPGPVVWCGVAVVAAGVGLGMRAGRS